MEVYMCDGLAVPLLMKILKHLKRLERTMATREQLDAAVTQLEGTIATAFDGLAVAIANETQEVIEAIAAVGGVDDAIINRLTAMQASLAAKVDAAKVDVRDTVVGTPPQGFALFGPTAPMAVGDTFQLTWDLLGTVGTPEFGSSADGVLAVNAAGLLTAIAPGVAVIVGSFRGLDNSLTITVA